MKYKVTYEVNGTDLEFVIDPESNIEKNLSKCDIILKIFLDRQLDFPETLWPYYLLVYGKGFKMFTTVEYGQEMPIEIWYNNSVPERDIETIFNVKILEKRESTIEELKKDRSWLNHEIIKKGVKNKSITIIDEK